MYRVFRNRNLHPRCEIDQDKSGDIRYRKEITSDKLLSGQLFVEALQAHGYTRSAALGQVWYLLITDRSGQRMAL
jgi:hypothetical protein